MFFIESLPLRARIKGYRMNRLLALLLIIIIGVQTIHQGLIYTYFTLSKDYIVQNLCENKKTPALKCNGKCHLREVLASAKKEKHSEQAPVPNLDEIKVPLLFFQDLRSPINFIDPSEFIREQGRAIFYYTFQYTHQVIITILQPPQV